MVIAVIALLAALLLPALAGARDCARRAKCMSNLRQFGLATQMYWDDNGGACFRYQLGATNGGVLYWFGWLASGVEGQRVFDATPGALYTYLQGRGVELCPALNYSSPNFKAKASGAAYGYGYNLSLSAPASQPALRVAKIARPTDTVIMADAAQANTFLAPASPQHPMLEEFFYVSPLEPTAHFRHRQRGEVLFCDGHVASERPLAGSLDARLPAEWLGKLRPEILVLP